MSDENQTDENQPRLTEAQILAVQAMAESGMPVSKIAEALGIPENLIERMGEWRVGRIEAIRVEQLEAELIRPQRNYRDLPAKKRAFLAALEANGGNRTGAAAAVGIERTLAYRWLKEDPEYAKAFEEALSHAADVLEDEVVRRAKAGILEPIYNRAGNLIGHKLRYSDSLLLARLAADRPDRWRSRVSAELTGKDGAPLETKPVLPAWLLNQLKPPPTGDTTPSPASGDSTGI